MRQPASADGRKESHASRFGRECLSLELRALKLLREYAGKVSRDPERFIPIPIEHLIENYLGLRIEFDDLNSPDAGEIFGALSIPNRTITLDESLDPVLYPENLAIYRMTLAHEVGHFVLHANEGAKKGTLCRLVPSNVSQPSDANEVEAEIFALHLLTPRDWVVHGVRTRFERVAPIIVSEQRRFLANCPPDTPPMSWYRTNWDEQLSEFAVRADWCVCWDLARLFGVAPETLYRKLVYMGLIRWHRAWVWHGMWLCDPPQDGFISAWDFLWSDWFVPDEHRDHFWLRDPEIQRAHWTSRPAFAESGRARYVITCEDSALTWKGKTLAQL